MIEPVSRAAAPSSVGSRAGPAADRGVLTTSSSDILAQVLNALFWDCAVPRHRVSVTFEQGWVTLTGEVDWPYQRCCAECDARRVPGVLGVTNAIRVRPGHDEKLRLAA